MAVLEERETFNGLENVPTDKYKKLQSRYSTEKKKKSSNFGESSNEVSESLNPC